MTTAAHVLMGIAAVLLFAAALITVARIAHGPSQLDRSAAADLTVAVVIASVGLWAAYADQSTEVNILLLLSMLGFTSAVAVARMVSDRFVSRRNFAAAHHDPEVSDEDRGSGWGAR